MLFRQRNWDEAYRRTVDLWEGSLPAVGHTVKDDGTALLVVDTANRPDVAEMVNRWDEQRATLMMETRLASQALPDGSTLLVIYVDLKDADDARCFRIACMAEQCRETLEAVLRNNTLHVAMPMPGVATGPILTIGVDTDQLRQILSIVRPNVQSKTAQN